MASSLINDGQCVMTIRALGTVVPDSLEAYMRDRISRLSRLGWSFTHVAVEIEHERNPRMADSANRVQVPCRNPHLVVRAEFADVTAAAAFVFLLWAAETSAVAAATAELAAAPAAKITFAKRILFHSICSS